MYKVMLVDDDYPVLEYLAESINWEELGMAPPTLHTDGEEALGHAIGDMPDIVITDIGMPNMDGLELIERLREMKPGVRVAILSCHSQFHYARQALKLKVQDYLLKETLDPSELVKLLLQFKESLDQERLADREQEQLRHIVNRNREKMKETFIRATIHQPILHPEEWKRELVSFGLSADGTALLPVLAHLDHFTQARKRFRTEDVLRFAVLNVVEEVASARPGVAYFPYSAKRSFFLFAFEPSLKINPYDEAASFVRQVLQGVRQSLKLSLSFIIGDPCRSPLELQKELSELLFCEGQRFYLEDGAVVKKGHPRYADADLFRDYDRAREEFRNLLLADRRDDALSALVRRWMTHFRERPRPPETIKDWVLKLLLDLKLKVHSLRFFQAPYTAEALHQEISEIESLSELENWLTARLQSLKPVVKDILQTCGRPEIMQAYQYVAANLDKKIGLEEMAAHLHLNPSYFSRMFKKETGETFTDFVIRMKMERARELLDTTEYPVGRICDMLGYDNQSYFIKTFKSVVGVTPMEYRRIGVAGK
ncbi:MAG TPA: helix-turn-helix domain-containing protein [Paenibacillaceae bacterium]